MLSAALRSAVVRAPAAPAVRTMATLKEVANRIKSVKNIAKITKSMKMVAASKLRRATATMTQAREYVAGVQSFFAEAPQPEAAAAAAPGTAAASGTKKKHLILAVTTDRGLCGGINSTVSRTVRGLVKAEEASSSVELVVVGDKGVAQMRRDLAPLFSAVFVELNKMPLTWAVASIIADKVLATGFDELTIVHNAFVNKISFQTVKKSVRSLRSFQDSKLEAATYEFDSDCLQDLYEFYLANTLFHVLVENSTVELSSRTMAMDNATRNASQMIDRLTLFYNRSRQATITKELIEIISGASAV